ncbi:M42 family metallopeptidase [Chloroflexota bacterium]
MSIKPNPNWKAPRIGAAQIKLLEQLSNATGVSGNEDAIRTLVLEQVKDLADDIQLDAIGNVLVTKRGKGRNLPRVMLAVHMDEIGFMLVKDEGDGTFQFEIVGGVDHRQLAGKPVWVGNDNIPGVIGAKPIHLTTASERESTIPASSLRIDIGKESKGKIKTGDWATFSTRFKRLGPSLMGKALDDRLGVATLILLLQNAPENIDLLAAFTVQEEVGLRGAQVAAYNMHPDMAIALDCTPAMDMPVWDDSENTLYRARAGFGPAIYVADGATLPDPRLIAHLEAAAKAYNIPCQRRQPGGGGTDAGSIHKQRGGIPSISVSVPGRYLHTAASLIRLADWRNSLALLHAALSHFNRSTLKEPRR